MSQKSTNSTQLTAGLPQRGWKALTKFSPSDRRIGCGERVMRIFKRPHGAGLQLSISFLIAWILVGSVQGYAQK
ncbi:MAG: hypothetical protein ACREAC_02415, partial [Blastocatellia bacterium]